MRPLVSTALTKDFFAFAGILGTDGSIVVAELFVVSVGTVANPIAEIFHRQAEIGVRTTESRRIASAGIELPAELRFVRRPEAMIDSIIHFFAGQTDRRAVERRETRMTSSRTSGRVETVLLVFAARTIPKAIAATKESLAGPRVTLRLVGLSVVEGILFQSIAEAFEGDLRLRLGTIVRLEQRRETDVRVRTMNTIGEGTGQRTAFVVVLTTVDVAIGQAMFTDGLRRVPAEIDVRGLIEGRLKARREVRIQFEDQIDPRFAGDRRVEIEELAGQTAEIAGEVTRLEAIAQFGVETNVTRKGKVNELRLLVEQSKMSEMNGTSRIFDDRWAIVQIVFDRQLTRLVSDEDRQTADERRTSRGKMRGRGDRRDPLFIASVVTSSELRHALSVATGEGVSLRTTGVFFAAKGRILVTRVPIGVIERNVGTIETIGIVAIVGEEFPRNALTVVTSIFVLFALMNFHFRTEQLIDAVVRTIDVPIADLSPIETNRRASTTTRPTRQTRQRVHRRGEIQTRRATVELPVNDLIDGRTDEKGVLALIAEPRLSAIEKDFIRKRAIAFVQIELIIFD